ncbi:hypothetical protein [Chengkuizengella axinellae]|uniref:Uncharacterized protein n=1 Tax=Chengkuizengella axinellae TaxID=3064388 RepID=A0ABT9IZA9_9BACL|nr:hypothetical protein [Chengkuizengella sp. 2205SS18-9]MDP5274653.1 hypothetical protein [Chengkuizengella sp. 2205SS18-9]
MLLKKARNLFFSILVLSLVFIPVIGSGGFAHAEKIFEKNKSRTEVLDIIKNNGQKPKINIIGNIKVTEEINSLVNIKNINSLDKVDLNEDLKTIWIESKEMNKFLNNQNKLEKLLESGVSIYIIGTEDVNLLHSIFKPSSKVIEEEVDGNTPDFQYVTQNNNDEYFIGRGYFSEELLDNEKLEAILSSAWNRKNDINFSSPVSHENANGILNNKLQSILYSTVAAADYDDFEIDPDWDIIDGWDSYEWYGSYGDVAEWKAEFHYNDGSDDYYAMAASTQMIPNESKYASSDYLLIKTEADVSQDNELFSYGPKNQPSSDQITFNIGASGNTPSIGASYTVTDNDLEISTSGTSSTSEIYQVKFIYDAFSNYAEAESTQNWALIVQSESTNNDFVTIYNKRSGRFYDGYWHEPDGHDDELITKSYNTNIYK